MSNLEVNLMSFRLKRKYIITLIIFIFFFTVYLIFLTNDHFSVDGATRCLEVFWSEKVILHGNNHILYPFNVYLWYKLTSFFLGESKNPFEFIRRIQIMNALASSIILSLSYLIYLKFLKKEIISSVLIFVFGLSNVFFSHAVSSAEPIYGFLFFVISFWLVVYFSDNKKISPFIFALSAFLFAYSIMSYLAMVFGLPVILVYLYYKTRSKKKVIGYFILFFIFLTILFIVASYYKGFTILEIDKALLGNEFADRSHTGFKLKNIPQYPFGMINAFYHINSVYDLPTYISSLLAADTNSLFSVIFGFILAFIIFFLIFNKAFFESLNNIIVKKEFSLFAISLIYFLSATIVIIGFIPVYDKLWIMGLNSSLLFGGIIYEGAMARRKRIVNLFFLIAILIMIFFNFGFAIKSKTPSSDIDCVEDSLKLMDNKYILLTTWGATYGKYFPTFYYNEESKYYRIPNLAIDYDMDTKKVIAFLKNEFCSEEITFYVTSDLSMSEYMWNTFLGDEMKMDYRLFHEELLDHVSKVTECVYEVDRSICSV